jgi:hypothetical protein
MVSDQGCLEIGMRSTRQCSQMSTANVSDNKVFVSGPRHDKAGRLAGFVALLAVALNIYVFLVIFHIWSIVPLEAALHRTFSFKVSDQFNLLAGLQATSAVICVLSDYFNPPRRGSRLKHPNMIARICAGTLALASGGFWIASAITIVH